MKKQDLLKLIAAAGYDIGFGAKTHFATLDIVEKAPGWLGLVSLAGGVYSLFVPLLASQHAAAAFVIFGIVSLYVNFYNSDKAKYEVVGKALTQRFHELHSLYRRASSLAEGEETAAIMEELDKIRQEANAIGLSKQIFLSDWYAHYKFFWQMQTEWIQEARPFSFWRDKVPLSFYFACVVAFLGVVIWLTPTVKSIMHSCG